MWEEPRCHPSPLLPLPYSPHCRAGGAPARSAGGQLALPPSALWVVFRVRRHLQTCWGNLHGKSLSPGVTRTGENLLITCFSPVMVNCMCQLYWVKGHQIAGKTSWQGVSRIAGRDEPLTSGLRNDGPPGAGEHPSTQGGPHRAEGRRRCEFLPWELGQLSSPALGHLISWCSGRWAQTRVHTAGSPGSQALGLGLDPCHLPAWASSLQTADGRASQS